MNALIGILLIGLTILVVALFTKRAINSFEENLKKEVKELELKVLQLNKRTAELIQLNQHLQNELLNAEEVKYQLKQYREKSLIYYH